MMKNLVTFAKWHFEFELGEKNMILVSGGTGFIGSRPCVALAQAGRDSLFAQYPVTAVPYSHPSIP